MASLAEIRQRHPQYSDMSDQSLADALYAKSYSDMPRADFDASIGMTAPAAPEQVTPTAEPFSGSILPMSGDDQGNVRFDSDAGLVGFAKRAIQLPRQVVEGEIDPTSEEGARRTLESALLMSPLSAAGRAGGMIPPGVGYKQPPKPVPTEGALRDAASASYKAVEDADVRFAGDAIEKMVLDLETKLNEQGSFKTVKGIDDVYAALAELKGAPAGGYVELSRLDSFRQGLSDLASSPKKQVRRAAATAIKELDAFIASPNSANLANRAAPGNQGLAPLGASFAAGDAAANQRLAQEASEAILAARGNYAAASRSGKIGELEDIMGLRASSANSGMNVDNTSRSKLVSLLINGGGKNVRGFSAAEKTAIREIIDGSASKNALRRLGNMLGGGGGLGQTLMTFGPAGAVAGAGGSPGMALAATAPGMVGALSKSLGNRLARSDIKQLDEFIRMRSPLYKDAPMPMPTYAPGGVQGGIEATGRALGASQLPVYRPRRPAPSQGGGMTQKMMRALLADPSGA